MSLIMTSIGSTTTVTILCALPLQYDHPNNVVCMLHFRCNTTTVTILCACSICRYNTTTITILCDATDAATIRPPRQYCAMQYVYLQYDHHDNIVLCNMCRYNTTTMTILRDATCAVTINKPSLRRLKRQLMSLRVAPISSKSKYTIMYFVTKSTLY